MSPTWQAVLEGSLRWSRSRLGGDAGRRRHLESHAPSGANVTVERTKEAAPFRAATDGPGYAAARQALADAYGSPAGEAGARRLDPAPQHIANGRPDRRVHPLGGRGHSKRPHPRGSPECAGRESLR
jgi:hypothetical protein